MTLEQMFIELHLLKGDRVTYELACDGVPMGLCCDGQYSRYPNAFGTEGVADKLSETKGKDKYFREDWSFVVLEEGLQERTEEDLMIREESIKYWRDFKLKSMGKG